MYFHETELYLPTYGYCNANPDKRSHAHKNLRKATVQEFRSISARAKDIGADNPLLSSYVLAAWFIAINRCNQLSSDQNYQILEQGAQRQ